MTLAAITVSGAALVIFASPHDSAPVMVAPRPRSTVMPQALQAHVSGVDTRMVGSVLLIVGLAVMVVLTLVWLWLGPGRRSFRRPYIDDHPIGPAY